MDGFVLYMEVMDRFEPNMEVSLHPAYGSDVPYLLIFSLIFPRILLYLYGEAVDNTMWHIDWRQVNLATAEKLGLFMIQDTSIRSLKHRF